VLEAVFILLEPLSPSRRIFIGSHSLPPLVRRFGPSELVKLWREAEELAKTKRKLLAIQQEAEAAKEIQRHKAEIAKLQEDLRTIKAKQSLCFNQPSPKYSIPNQSTFTKGNVPFAQPPPFTTFSRSPFINPFESGPSNHDIHTIRT
jgi:hypothetical protein